MFPKLFFIFILIGIPEIGISQINDENIRVKVLHKNVIGKEFVFGKCDEKAKTETHLTYLGRIKTKKGKTYKLMNSAWIWGSHRATNRILIFNGNNQYLGNYAVTMTSDLPTELNNGILVFRNTDSECDKKVASRISFKNGLPKEFFRKCNNEYGDIYSFDGNN
ncbi:hypothetical protein IRZ71_00150 [Flavobacterium sp. ANB]|uniref:hypothetical protein n=1 Tax=unclassified Flavobacterium TaxID=196869 RepID=UPI0012B6FAE2|nr:MULTISPECIES: hypothetical protein [unclassified Flavobacterium]MBF4514730.1 hypothetical protein [Flavobacterium sp. ANB]MTD68056.1 hypothetical protein [Flavobacterium sp. LC2016-13]